jgi:Flp pilus assembly pilin Flp
MKHALKTFARDESGAITVDWVVLSAAIIGLGMVVLIPIAYSSGSSAQGISDYISGIDVGYENNN